MSFSENFRTARINAKLTQQQVADILGLDRSAITHYELGNSMPSAKNIRKICEMFNITFEELFRE